MKYKIFLTCVPHRDMNSYFIDFLNLEDEDIVCSYFLKSMQFYSTSDLSPDVIKVFKQKILKYEI